MVVFATATVVVVVGSGGTGLIVVAGASVVAAVPKLHLRPVIPVDVWQYQALLWVPMPTDFCASLPVSAHQETEVLRITLTALPELQVTPTRRIQAQGWVQCPLY